MAMVKKKIWIGCLILILFISVIILLSLLSPKPCEKLLILGSNLGTWGVRPTGEIDEPFVLNPVQRKLARGVIGTFRINPDCEGELCVNGLIPDHMLLDLLNKIEEVEAEPFCVLSMNDDWKAKHIVELFKGRVKYYEFGNEPGWVYGSAENYTERWNYVVPQLKAIDSNIKVGGPVDGGCDEWGQNYIRTFLKLANPKPDFVSWHMYAGRKDDSDSEIINKTSQWGKCIDIVENDVIIPTLGHSLPIVISEWNWNPLPDHEGDFRDEDEQFMWNFTSTAIEEFRDNRNLLMAHQYCYGAHCANGHLAMIAGDWPYSEPKSQYYVFLHYAKILCPECQRG
jgi:hypothetical protein